jgi:hypothetical protein
MSTKQVASIDATFKQPIEQHPVSDAVLFTKFAKLQETYPISNLHSIMASVFFLVLTSKKGGKE